MYIFPLSCSVNITQDSEAWVGAWWLGPLMGSALALLFAIPIYGFPNKLPGKQYINGLNYVERFEFLFNNLLSCIKNSNVI